ncbi:MAG: HypC/HybG/HupF family hydrogenase formation chaperone [Gammaproteobacteria bacterium]
MCLGIPMQINNIDGFVARCEAKGVFRDVNLFLLQDAGLQPGDYVLVHVGYALQKISEAHARSAWELYDEMLAAMPEDEHA